jgi:Trypsin
MRRVVLVLATMALTIVLAGGVAQAIINGEPDRGPNAHPYVGAYVAKDGGKLRPVCSGTLISPKIFLTAGHCTKVEIERNRPAYVTFDPTYKPETSRRVKGTPYLHPKACLPPTEGCVPESKGRAGVGYFRYDAGVVVLKEPVRMASYGDLPDAGLVDTLKVGKRLTTVGYGLRVFDPLGGERYNATVRLLKTNHALGDMFVKTTGSSLIKGKGEASCYGDSGGPLFLPDQQTIVGVTSFGNRVCRGPAYYQRVDLPQVLKWVRSFP